MSNKELSQEQMEQIEAFLLHQMSPTEHEAFQKRIDADSALKDDVDLFQSMILSIEAKEVKNAIQEVFKNETLIQTGTEQKEEAKIKSLSLLKYIIPLAAALTAAIFYFNYSSPLNEPSIFADLYEADAGLPTLMGKTAKMKFYDGMVDYKMGDYSSALNTWEPLLTNDQNNDTLQFFVAISNMEKGDLFTAKKLFSAVSRQPNSTFQEKAIWYETLLWVKEENYSEASKSLNRIHNTDGDLKEKVEILREKLANF